MFRGGGGSVDIFGDAIDIYRGAKLPKPSPSIYVYVYHTRKV